jgi:hypothetical protein
MTHLNPRTPEIVLHNQEYLKTYKETIQNNWPWHESTEEWIAYLFLIFEHSTMISSVFLDPKPLGGGLFCLRIDGLVIELLHFAVDEYLNLLKALQSHLSPIQVPGKEYLQEGLIQSKTGHFFWTGILSSALGLQVTIRPERNRLTLGYSRHHLPEQAATVIERMRKHPNGLMLFCHRTWSHSPTGIMYDVFQSIVDGCSTDARLAFISENLQSIPVNENITKISTDGTYRSWEKATHAVVAQDVDIIMMQGRNERDVVAQAILTALEDRIVLVDTTHFNVLDALLWLLTDIPISSSLIASILLGVVGSYADLRTICPNCSIEQTMEEMRLLLDLRKCDIELGTGTWLKGQGCPLCNGTGYANERLTIAEAIYIDHSLAKICASSPNRAELTSVLQERNFSSYFDQAYEFARQGKTTLQEAIRVGLARRADL